MVRLAFALLAASGTASAWEGGPFFVGEEPSSLQRIQAGHQLTEIVHVASREGDSVEVTAASLPSRAFLRVRDPRPCREFDKAQGVDPKAVCRDVVLSWKPTEEQVGEHRIVLQASDGKATRRLELNYLVEDQWESWFLPGIQYAGYFPSGRRSVGSFNGAAFELVIASWVHQNDERGPSHGRVYLDLGGLASDRSGAGRAFAYALGLDLSVERNPRRKWLIPIFGLEVGGFSQREAGTFFTATPLVGAHVFAARNVFVTVTGGYVFPGRDFDQLGGWRIRAGVDAVLW